MFMTTVIYLTFNKQTESRILLKGACKNMSFKNKLST